MTSTYRRTILRFLLIVAVLCVTTVSAPVKRDWKTELTAAITKLTSVLEKYPPAAETQYTRSYYRHCSHAYAMGRNHSGVYLIKPDQNEPFEVFCDMETAGGGWTVVQRRVDGSVDFNRPWKDYVNGFGSISGKSGEFWLGLEKMYRLSASVQTSELMINLWDFEDTEVFAHYKSFALGPKTTEYKLLIGDYNGTSGDTLSHVSGISFSTSDNDNDISLSRVNCAELYGSGWWFRDSACGLSNLNGRYLAGKHYEGAKQGIYWHYFRGVNYSLKFSEMKIRGEDY